MANINDIANALEKLGATVDRQNFATNMQKPEFAERVRVSLEGAGASVPDSATFYNRYGVDRVQQAKAQYAQDVAAQKQENIQTAKRDNPNLAAFLPRTLENAVAGDRGKWGNVLDFAKDVTSLPGRMADATLGNLSENVANLIYGPKDIQSQWELAKESQKANLARMAQVELPPEASGVERFAHGMVTDPYAIPLIAVGGPVASALGKTGLTGKALVGAGIAADAALNAATGIVDRSASADPNVKALSASDIAKDAVLGGAFSGLVRGLGGLSSKLQRSGAEAMGNDIIGSTPLKKREDLISNWSESGRASSPTDRQTAARNIGEELLTSRKETRIPAKDQYPETVVSAPDKLALGVTGAKEKILENQLQKQAEARRELDQLYGEMDYAYHRDVQRIKDNPEALRGIDVAGNPVHEVDLRTSGVPIDELISQSYRTVTGRSNKAVDSKAIGEAANDLIERLNRIKSEQGTISPSAARDLKQRLYNEIRDNPKAMDLDEFYTELYNNINGHISGMEAARTGAIQPEEAAAFGRLARASGLETPFASANREVRSALQLGEGLERSKYFNPSQTKTPFGETMDILALGTQLANPALLAVGLAKGPIARVQAGRALASENIVPRAMQVAARTASANSDEKRRLDAASRGMTEMEYRNASAIVAKRKGDRTPQEVEYLKSLGI